MTKEDKQAKAAHDIWSHWMKYMFTQGSLYYGDLILSEHNVDRWKRLINTEFEDLTDDEKKSDYEVAKQFLNDI